MHTIPSRLEFLPNETLIQILQYLDLESLFRAFDHLNYRFDKLLRTINHLVYYLWDDKYTQIRNIIPYIDSLSVCCQVDLDLNQFSHIRHLKLIYLTNQLLQQFHTHTLPRLEHLFVKQLTYNLGDILYDKIFSNTFPKLKYCYICKNSQILNRTWLIKLPVLYSLHIGIIDLSVYHMILSNCMNLNSFEFRLKSSKKSSICKSHNNLKRMKIKSEELNHDEYNAMINTCLSYVPNLEHLRIYQDFTYVNIPQYLIYDWHASFIANYVLKLRRFGYYLNIWYSTSVEIQIGNIFDEVRKNFANIHCDRYQSKFQLKLVY